MKGPSRCNPISEPPGIPDCRTEDWDDTMRQDLRNRLESGEDLGQIFRDIVSVYFLSTEVPMSDRYSTGSEVKITLRCTGCFYYG